MKSVPILNLTLLLVLFFMVQVPGRAQQKILYKPLGETNLYMEMYQPPTIEDGKKYPAMVFFFGGGWIGGNTQQFQPHATYFSKRGIICLLVDYRVRDRQGTTPFESLKDAKSAIRFIRKHADMYQIDGTKIIAAGGSAGGHLAAATAMISTYDEASDNLEISCIPNALVLFNPVIDNGPGGYGYERIGDDYKDFSPLHNIMAGVPPTLVFLGTKDPLIPVETAAYFKKTMERIGNRCDLYTYEGQVHGFFNYRNFEYYKKTVTATDYFLQSMGYLSRTSRLVIE